MPLTVSRIPLGRAHMLASIVVREAQRAGLPTESMRMLGSLRRYAPDVGNVSLLLVAPPERHTELLDAFAHLRVFTGVVASSSSGRTMVTERGPVTVYAAPPDDAGAALVWHTGSRAHTTQLQHRARQRGLELDGARLTRTTGEAVPTSDEDELYRHLGLPFIAPELREGAEEISAAE